MEDSVKPWREQQKGAFITQSLNRQKEGGVPGIWTFPCVERAAWEVLRPLGVWGSQPAMTGQEGSLRAKDLILTFLPPWSLVNAPRPNAWNHKEARGQGNLLKESIHAFSLSGQRGSGGVNQRHPALRGNLFWQHRSMVRNFPERKNNLRFLFLFFKCRYLDLLPTRRRFWIIRSGIGLMSVLLQQCKVFSRYSLDHTVRNSSLNIEWGSCLRKLPLGANFHVKVFAENSWESRHPVTWWSIELSIYLWIKTLRI